MKEFFLTSNGDHTSTLMDLPQWPVDKDLEPALARLNGEDRFSLMIGALPESITFAKATRRDFLAHNCMQAGGRADRLLLQVGREEAGRDVRMYNVSFVRTPASAPLTERIDHGLHHTMVRPEEVMTWEQALPIMVHYVRNDQQIPKGLFLRDFGKPEAPSIPS